jgi:nicotinamidase-related amidase
MRSGLLPMIVMALSSLVATGQDYEMRLCQRVEVKPGEFRMVETVERWKPSETAVIVCDMWDLHHCKNAVDRVGQMAPHMNELLKAARKRGSLIVHAPSSCMEFYQDHPARKRAVDSPKAGNVPKGINEWMTWIDEREEKVGYPIDHSDGGEDDEPAEHAEWAKTLTKMGKNPRAPWTRQVAGLDIDGEKDAITDDGTQNWNLLEERGVKNVILLGVHTNMCVLGRPFGLRQLAKNGKNVVLMRDLTDTMYNPKMKPQVSHFRGTDLIVEHIEKYVCPTVTSDQILGGAPYRFETDARKHIVFLIGEREYETEETLPPFAEKYLSSDFRCTFVFAGRSRPYSQACGRGQAGDWDSHRQSRLLTPRQACAEGLCELGELGCGGDGRELHRPPRQQDQDEGVFPGGSRGISGRGQARDVYDERLALHQHATSRRGSAAVHGKGGGHRAKRAGGLDLYQEGWGTQLLYLVGLRGRFRGTRLSGPASPGRQVEPRDGKGPRGRLEVKGF